MQSITISDLPRLTHTLPFHGRRIFLKFYNRGMRMGLSKQAANRVAWVAVKKKYYKIDGCWLPYADDNYFDTTSSDSDSTEDLKYKFRNYNYNDNDTDTEDEDKIISTQ
ncbi:ChaB2 [Orgyia pseudotsugata single capsid nuclopolyhedrovirus]|nr:ChaB2 [Orgyia pseudotsugata single capsid nuclopolyhedrovirus]